MKNVHFLAMDAYCRVTYFMDGHYDVFKFFVLLKPTTSSRGQEKEKRGQGGWDPAFLWK